MNEETDTSVETEQLSNRIKSCWSFGNPYSLRFLDDPPPADPPPADPPASLINPDGIFVENWPSKAPEGFEELRDDETLPRSKNIWELAKSHVKLRKKLSVDKMPRPTDKWGEDDWNEFYDASGRPSTAADFNIKRADGISEEVMPQKEIDGYQDLFHKIGLNQKQVDAITEYNNDKLLAVSGDVGRANEHRHTVMMDSLYAEFGQATEQRTRWSNGAIERGIKGNEELRAFIQKKMNTENDIVPWSIFLSNIESNFAEHGEFADPHIDTPNDIKTQIDELMRSPDHTSTDLKIRQRNMDRILKLRETITKGAIV